MMTGLQQGFIKRLAPVSAAYNFIYSVESFKPLPAKLCHVQRKVGRRLPCPFFTHVCNCLGILFLFVRDEVSITAYR
jgi:hypothetical protein